MADRPVPPLTPAPISVVPGIPCCSFTLYNVNKRSHPEFERKGCVFMPLKDN